MKKVKKVVALLLVLMLIVSLTLVGCSGRKEDVSQGTTGTTAQGTTTKAPDQPPEREMLGNMYLTGLPIVKEPITLKVGNIRPAHIGAYAEMELLKELEEKTNILVEWREFPSDSAGEQINLMIASQDFPDVFWRGLNDQQILDLGESGDIISLDDLIETYAPNWVQAFARYPYSKKMATMLDGKIYSLPFIRDDESNSGFRDVTFINQKWLDELGLSIPKNVDEFYDVLIAFRDAAKDGRIISDAVPWYWHYRAYVGGKLDFYGSFGLPDYPNRMAVENGQVIFTPVREGYKETIQFLHRAYKEGLVPPEAFTDDWGQYIAKRLSDPPIFGVWYGYNIPNADLLDTYVALPPLYGSDGRRPQIKQQTNTVERNFFTIFSNNKYPEATMRWADMMAEEEFSIQGMYGLFGTHIEHKSDGSYEIIPDPDNTRYKAAPMNFAPLVLTADRVSKIQWAGMQEIRANYFEVYKPYVVPLEEIYSPVLFTEEQRMILQRYSTDLNGYINETQARWIVDGGIENEWDSFIKRLYDLNLEEVLRVHQEALDAFNQ